MCRHQLAISVQFLYPYTPKHTQFFRKCTYPRHKFHKNRQLFLHRIPQAAIVLHYTLVTQILQELDLTLQRIHLLHTKTNVKNRAFLQCINTVTSSDLPCWSLDTLGQRAPVWLPVRAPYRHHSRDTLHRKLLDQAASLDASLPEPSALRVKKKQTTLMLARPQTATQTRLNHTLRLADDTESNHNCIYSSLQIYMFIFICNCSPLWQ